MIKILAPQYTRTLVRATSHLHYHTYDVLLEVTGICPHQVLLDRKIDYFSHKEASDALAAVAARFPHPDVSADSDLDASQ